MTKRLLRIVWACTTPIFMYNHYMGLPQKIAIHLKGRINRMVLERLHKTRRQTCTKGRRVFFQGAGGPDSLLGEAYRGSAGDLLCHLPLSQRANHLRHVQKEQARRFLARRPPQPLRKLDEIELLPGQQVGDERQPPNAGLAFICRGSRVFKAADCASNGKIHKQLQGEEQEKIPRIKLEQLSNCQRSLAPCR